MKFKELYELLRDKFPCNYEEVWRVLRDEGYTPVHLIPLIHSCMNLIRLNFQEVAREVEKIALMNIKEKNNE